MKRVHTPSAYFPKEDQHPFSYHTNLANFYFVFRELVTGLRHPRSNQRSYLPVELVSSLRVKSICIVSECVEEGEKLDQLVGVPRFALYYRRTALDASTRILTPSSRGCG